MSGKPRVLTLARARKAAWSFGDQGLSSGTNFILTILVARSVGAEEFGAFAVAMSVYLVCLTLGRSSVSEAIVLSLGRTDGLVQRDAAAGLSATLLLSGGALAVILGAAALLPSPDVATILMVLALGMPGLLVQDYRRIVFFALGQPERAFASDALWAVLQLAGIALAAAHGLDEPAALLGIWAASALLSAGLWPSTTRGWWRHSGLAWFRRERRVVLPLAGEGMVFQLGNQASVFLLGAIAGLAEAGGYRAAQALFGPVTILLLGLRTAVLPGLMRLSRRSTARALRVAAQVTLVASVFASLWGVGLMLLPDSLGDQLLGQTWTTAAMLIGLVTIDRAFSALSWGAGLRLRILRRVTFSFVVRVITTVTGLVIAVVGATVAGAWGVAVGMAIASPFLTGVAWYAAARARRSQAVTSEGPDADDGLETPARSGPEAFER